MDKDKADLRKALDALDASGSLEALEARVAKVAPIHLPPDDGLEKKWMALDRPSKITIAELLGLANPDERALDEFTYDRRVFLRVGGYSKRSELACEIEKVKPSKG